MARERVPMDIRSATNYSLFISNIRSTVFPWRDVTMRGAPNGFDHRDHSAKLFTLMGSRAGLMPLERIAAETAECDVVCANCHRVRTYRRRELQNERE
jgi:hypothetical protein